jgi:peptide/nickel transport system permease protein
VSRFILRRAVMVVPILLGVSIVVFITIKLIPGDPVSSLLGPTAGPEERAQLIAKYGFDQPLLLQYFHWLGSVLTGDLGRSIARQQDARPMVLDALDNTLILTGFALLLATVGGLVLGTLSALRRSKPSGAAASATAIAALSMPQYSIGLILIIYLSVQTGWFPSGGMYTVGRNQAFGDLLRHAVLPSITAALVPLGILARMFRSALLDALGQDWVEALRARGMPERRILLHAFHNALPAVLTIAGLQFGYLLGGVVFVETIFSWPGLGLLVFQSISQRDIAVIQAGVIVSALAFVLVNLFVDIVHGLIDPRVRTA